MGCVKGAGTYSAGEWVSLVIAVGGVGIGGLVPNVFFRFVIVHGRQCGILEDASEAHLVEALVEQDIDKM